MNERDIFTQRLVQFADYLASIKEPECPIFQQGQLVILEKGAGVKLPIEIEYRFDLFEHLSDVFDSWFIDPEGNPGWDEHPQQSTLESVFDFFNLSPDQFCVAFDLSTSAEKYNYKKLDHKSSRKDIAHNIVEMVRRRESAF